MPDIPVITTARLLLRGFTEADERAYFAMMGDPEVTRFLADGRTLNEVDAWRQMALIAGHWMLRGYGLWAVEELGTGRFVGRIGCYNPHGWPDFEIGYTIARPFWGKGYAREGAKAALAFAREELKRTRIISVIREGNARSVRVATSLGAVHESKVEFYGHVADIYAYPTTADA
jgi:RimJ/RimL family protein N-acetyltransferase